MANRTFLLSLLTFFLAVHAAPTQSLDAATLLQNGEEAQALNRYFRSLEATDTCQDGQVACLGSEVVMCNGTSWTTKVEKCAKSLKCFAMPSVKSQGTTITCTSERSAENLIAATGAVGGIFGQPGNGTMTVGGGNTNQRDSGTFSAPYAEGSNTVSLAPTLASSIADVPSSTTGGSTVNYQGGDANITPSRRPCTSMPTPTAVPGTTLLTASPPQVTVTGSPSDPQRITVTVTVIPTQLVTLTPQTRTVSPDEASSIIASIEAAGGSIVTVEGPSPYATATTLGFTITSISTTSFATATTAALNSDGDSYY